MAGNPADPIGAAPRFRPTNPVVIGITGGVAAGKSTVAGLFCDHGLAHVDADAHARAAAADPEIQAAVRAAFGPDVVTPAGLDRQALARIVFGDESRRAVLEAILHPPIRARILAELDACRARGDSVLLDAPLMHETGLVEFCDLTIYVEASDEIRRQRAAARGWSAGELERREAAQTPLGVKKQAASHIITNDGDLETTARQVEGVLTRLAAEEG